MLSVFEGGRKIPTRFKALLKQSDSALSEEGTQCNEYVLGIRTEPEIAVDSERIAAQEGGVGAAAFKNMRYGDNFQYGTTGYLNVRKVLGVVKPGPEDVFCDIGCGMGRILCVAAREPVRKYIGIELLSAF